MNFLQSLFNRPEAGLIAYVKTVDGKLSVTSYDNERLWPVNNGWVIDNAKTFIDNIPSLFCNKNKYLSVILNIFDYNAPEYPNSYSFIKALRSALTANGLPFWFITDEKFEIAQIFCAASIPFLPETTYMILVVIVNKDGFDVSEYKYNMWLDLTTITKLHQHKISLEEYKSEQVLHDKIIGSGGFSKIIISSTEPSMPLFKFVKDKVMHAETKQGIVIALDDCARGYAFRAVIEISRWLTNNNRKLSFCFYTCVIKYFVSYIASNGEEVEILVVNVGQDLAWSKTYILGQFISEVYIKYVEPKTNKIEIAEKVILPKTCHSTLITFGVDAQNWPSLTTSILIPPKITSLPQRLERLEEKIPVIGLLGLCSVVCIYKADAQSYKFLEGWNGSNGDAMIISFAKKKPEFGMKVLESQKLNSSFVVYDIIKIMSMPVQNIQLDEEWGFKITKDDDNPVLLGFDSYDGEEKAASPSFLMAMILKQKLKVMTKVIGKRPEKVAFCLLNEDYDIESKNLMKLQLEAACELMTILCSFIDF